jgi:hypothetical protein
VNPEISPVKVLVAGAGYGGLETLAIKDTVADRAEITLLTPTVNLTYRPLSSGAPFVRELARTIEADAVASLIIETLGLGEPSGAPLPALHGIHLARWAHTHDHAVHAEIHWHRLPKNTDAKKPGLPVGCPADGV